MRRPKRATSPWTASFVVDGAPGGAIRLRQVTDKDFALESTIVYVGERTGLEGQLSEEELASIRQVDPGLLPVSDLASVPTSLQWFVSRYGPHTPAALIHDSLIGADADVRPVVITPEQADVFFRSMLRDLGIPRLRRTLMWAAVALRTRWSEGGARAAGIVVWIAASVGGTALGAVALARRDLALFAAAAAAPWPFAALWGRQYWAGIAGAYGAVWLLPPTVLGAAGYQLYSALEWLLHRAAPEPGTAPHTTSYESF